MKYTLKPIKAKKKADIFEIRITFMHGDADAYTHDTVTAKTKEKMEKIVKYTKLPEAKMDITGDEYEAWARKAPFEVPSDHTSDYQFKAMLDRVEVFFYDEKGDKFELEFVEK